jgi:Protein of unknown function (DUF3054)
MRTARAATTDVPRQDRESEAPDRHGRAGLLALDVLAVLLFAAAGRRTHAEGISVAGLLGTAWPFLAGTVTGWGIARAWRRPASLSTGLLVWVATVVVGMLLRRVVGDGTATAFVLVAATTLGALLLGWRVLTDVVSWLRDRRARVEVLGR